MLKQDFCKGMANWDNYKLLLWLALNETNGDILELGCGDGSTKLLQNFAAETGRILRSYDYDKGWAEKFGAIHVADNWKFLELQKNISVVLVDESPGEQRKFSIGTLRNNAEILIVHDSEPAWWNASDYKVRPLFKTFNYAVDLKSIESGGAWATALSNTIDITKWIGQSFENHKIIELQ